MPRRRKIQRRALRDELSAAQAFELHCQCWADPPRTFETEQDRRRAWEAHRDEIMARCRPGQRPAAWWRYDAPERPRVARVAHVGGTERHPAGWPVNVLEHETETLARLGLATPADLAELRQHVAVRRNWGCQGVDLDRQQQLLDSIMA